MLTETNVHGHSFQGMIFAAGLGTRFKPWTDFHPKALALVHGKTLLQRNVEYLQTVGIRDVVVNVHHFSDQIIHAIEDAKGWGSKISISDESDVVLETGGGLWNARSLFHADTLAIINADILTDLDLNSMIQHHFESRNLATLAVSNRSTSRYFLFNKEGELCGWRNVATGEEKMSKACSAPIQKAFSGIHVIQRSLIEKILQRGKFSMVEVYLELAKKERIGYFDHSGSRFLDVGKPDSVALAEQLWGSDT